MLTPEQIDALGQLSQKAVEPVVEFLLDDIARRIAEAGQFTSSAAYQIWRAQALGLSRKQIEKELRKRLKVSQKELKKLLKQSAEVGYNFDIDKLGVKAVPFAENESLQQIIAAAAKLADDDFKNITQTLGMIDPYGKPLPLADAYRSCCDFAFNQVITGATDYNTAIRKACKNLADKGIRTIDYESGVHTSLEAAVRRNIMGGLGLMQEQISQQNHDAFGANGWEISAHAASAPDHEPIQGKQYTDKEYAELNNSLVRRIGTLNCGHAAFPIIIGVNSPQYTPEQLEQFKQDNQKGVTYNGKHYTSYEATQKQRAIERAVRRQKHRVLVAESSGDKDALLTSQIKLRRLNEEYRRYSKAVNLPTQNERLQIAGFGKKQAAQATGANKKVEKVANSLYNLGDNNSNVDAYLKNKPVHDFLDEHKIKFIFQIDSKEFVVDAGKPIISGHTEHSLKNLQSKIDRANMTVEEAQKYVDNAKLTLLQWDRKTIKFLSDNGYAVLNVENKLVTAVPQKWRKKYDKYLKENQNGKESGSTT